VIFGIKVVFIIPVGGNPEGVQFDPVHHWIFVDDRCCGTKKGEVSIISDSTNSVRFAIPAGTEPIGGAFCPIDNEVYVTNYESNNVYVYTG
jgi:DNA-binding beta-propeller fold protein YncE